MKYLVVLSQHEGCDYTIGCGMKTMVMEAPDEKALALQLQEMVKGDYSSDEFRLESIRFYEIGSTYEVDITKRYSKIDAEREAEKRNAIAAQELEEFNRIKKKYNL